MIRPVTSPAAPAAASAYAPAIAVPAGARWLILSGQIGAHPDGSVPDDPAEQHRLAWANVLALLAADGMGPRDIVEVTGIVTDPGGVALFRQARDAALGGHLAASTLWIAGLADPRWTVEIAVRAAAA